MGGRIKDTVLLWVHTVISFLGLLPPLLVAEYQVDPVVQVLRDVVALQGLSQVPDEVLRPARPRRELNAVHVAAILSAAEVDELRKRENNMLETTVHKITITH